MACPLITLILHVYSNAEGNTDEETLGNFTLDYGYSKIGKSNR